MRKFMSRIERGLNGFGRGLKGLAQSLTFNPIGGPPPILIIAVMAFGLLMVWGMLTPPPSRTVDLPPGQKVVNAYLLHEGRAEQVKTRPMRPGEKAETHTLVYRRENDGAWMVTVTIREHDLAAAASTPPR